jgi:hypothetical protein
MVVSRARRSAVWIAGATVCVLAVSYLTLRADNWNDYTIEARPAFDALVHGHLHRFLQLAPGYGGSLALRSPFVLLAHAFGANEHWMFRAGAIPCLVAAAVLGLCLVSVMRRHGASTLAQVLVLVLCALNPLTIQAVRWGHPEEVLGAALCVAAVLAALRNRPIWAGVLLGLAIGNKAWAVLAVGPVLIALPQRRLLAMGCAGLVGAALVVPFVLGGAGALPVGTGNTGSTFQRWQVWWFFGIHRPPLPRGVGPLLISARTAPGWLSGITHPLIAAVGLPLSALYAWLRRQSSTVRSAPDALLLLALLLLLRCVLDPWDFSYYPLPFLFALAAWEAVRFARPPVLSMVATVAAWLVMYETAMPIFSVPQDVQTLIFLSVSLPAVGAIAVALFRPRLRSSAVAEVVTPARRPAGVAV